MSGVSRALLSFWTKRPLFPRLWCASYGANGSKESYGRRDIHSLGCDLMQGLEPTRSHVKSGSVRLASLADGFNVNLFSLYLSLKLNQLYLRPKLSPIIICWKRRCSGGEGQDKDKKPKTPALMEFEPKFMPNLWYSLQNFLLTVFVIRPHLDPQFTIREFMAGAKQAFVFISNQLAEGNFEAIKGLIDKTALDEIKKNYNSFDEKQRKNLRIAHEDITSCFPYRVGVMMPDGTNKRFVEITVVFHCFEGYANYQSEFQKQAESSGFPSFSTFFGNNKDRISVCNYRFIREMTKGVEDEWLINQLNHFKPDNLLDQK